jgi:DNA-binding CsgD family transcriptional regulator
MARLSGAERAAFLAVKSLCYAGLGSADLRAAIGHRLARHLRADAFAFLALHPASGLPVHAVHDWPAGMCEAAHERAVLVSPVADFGRRAAARRRAYRVEELAAGGRPGADPYVADVLGPFGFAHEVQVGFAAGGRAWGNLQLERRSGREPFPGRALALLAALAPHVTAGLRAAATRAALAARPAGAIGVVLLGPDGRVELANGPAERLLARPSAPGRQSAWVAVQVVAALLARGLSEDGADGVPELTVADAELGGAYRLRAELARDAAGAPRALVLIEPAGAPATADGLRDLGLTPREAQVALAVVRGHPTREIAAALGVSPYTVQDHVRHICDKLGVGSRRALGALLLGALAPAGPHPVPSA